MWSATTVDGEAPGASHRRARLLSTTGVVLVAVLLTAWWRAPAPVGRFVSAQARDRFSAAYDAAMAELPPPDAVLDLRTDFGVVRAYRFDGPEPAAAPLVLLPGRAAASPMLADNVATLRAVRSVYTLDLLGEPGASVQDRPIEDAEEQARWLDQALAALPEPHFHLVGASIGGWTAANLAVHRPERVAGLVLVDPVMTFAPIAPEAVVRSIPASVRWLPRSWRDDFASWTAGGAPVEHEPVAEVIEAGMKTYRMATPGPRRFSDEELARVRMPVLAVLAGRSVMHDAAAAADEARRLLPAARVLLWAEATHAVTGEQPGRLAAEVAAFVGGSGR